MRKLLLSAFTLLLLATVATAQHRTCAAEEVLQQQLLNNPAMREEVENIMRHTEHFIQSGGAQERAVVTIPVVVHVVYFNSTQNISDAQIQTQIDVLNADFRRTNADASNARRPPACRQAQPTGVPVIGCCADRLRRTVQACTHACALYAATAPLRPSGENAKPSSAHRAIALPGN